MTIKNQTALAITSAVFLFLSLACQSEQQTPPALDMTSSGLQPVADYSPTLFRRSATDQNSSEVCGSGPVVPRPRFIKNVFLAKRTIGSELMSSHGADSYTPAQEEFHLVVMLDGAPGSTRLKVVWYVVEAKGFEQNRKIDEKEELVGGARDFDFTLSPIASPWPIGTYCAQLYADSQLVAVKRFAVKAPDARYNSVIVDTALAREVDPNTFAPVNPTRLFSANAPIIHCIVQVQDAAPGTRLKARWIFPDANVQEYELETFGSRRVDLTLTPGSKPFPSGEYRLEIYVNGELDRVEDFAVR